MHESKISEDQNGILSMTDQEIPIEPNTPLGIAICLIESSVIVSIYFLVSLFSAIIRFILIDNLLVVLIIKIAEIYILLYIASSFFHLSVKEFSHKIGIRLKPPSFFSVWYGIYQIIIVLLFYKLDSSRLFNNNTTVIEKSLINPFIEEVIFRGIIYHIMYNRYTEINKCILMSSTFFSLFHLINFFNNEYDYVYVIFQLIEAFLFGLISNFMLVINDNLMSGYFLHIVNNLMCFLIGFRSENILNHIPLIIVQSVVDMIIVFYSYNIIKRSKEE